MTLIGLFSEATLFVKLIIFLLLFLSIYSWAVILKKEVEIIKRLKEVKEINKLSKNNISKSWSEYLKVNKKGYFLNVIEKGFSAIKNVKKNKTFLTKEEVEYLLNYVKESMVLSIDREIQEAKRGVPVLATIGSVSPYIGLLGTVWGIMNSFINIGMAGQATLKYIAPSIAEALIATAIALIAAIPAYIGYNYFQNKIEELEEEYQLLKDEFCLSAKDNINRGKINEKKE